MNVVEAAAQLGVTPRRVRAMIADGRISAHRVGPHWVIDHLAPVKTRRSLSPRSWAMLSAALKGRTLEGLAGHDRSRIAERIRLLRESEYPSRLMVDWRPEAGRVDPFMDSLADHAALGDDSYVMAAIRRPAEYLRDPADLAEVVRSERTIRGEGRDALAKRSGVSVESVRDIETGRLLSSPSDVRSVLRALDVEPTALPTMVLS
jgi:excisionase family DNA binding protein